MAMWRLRVYHALRVLPCAIRGYTCQHSMQEGQPHVRRILVAATLGATAASLSTALIWKHVRVEAEGSVNEKTEKNGAMETSNQESESSDAEQKEDCKKKKQKVGFRDRRVIEYENRIRAFSTPDKIFRYFATLKIYNESGESDVFMTPQDFVRSITPNEKQPESELPPAQCH